MTKKPSTTLKAHAGRVARDADTAYLSDDTLPDEIGLTPEELVSSVGVGVTLATVLIHDTLRPQDANRISVSEEGIALVVGVPGADWVGPVAIALGRIRLWSELLKRTGAQRSSDHPGSGNDVMGRALACGHSVCGVSQAPERYLPAALLAAADIRVDLPSPSNRVIGACIRLVTGQRPRRMPPAVAAGLGFDAIVACIRKGTRAADCVRRLKAAGRTVGRGDPGLADVPGLEDAVGYGEETMSWGLGLVAAVKEFQEGTRSWQSIESRNIVLTGDAGTGKTTFARSLAKSTGLPLTVTSVSSWFATTNGYLNDICRKIDEVFANASASHGILLLDECDSIPNRDTVDSRHRDYWVPVVSHILTLLDGAASSAAARLIIIGTTNFAARLDPALVRPGRLDRIVRIERPDTDAIAAILRQHLGPDLEDEDLMPVAAIGAGASGAEVAGWARQARMAARAESRPMRLSDVLGQIAPPETRSPAILLATARHEAAHAVATEQLAVGEVEFVTIVAQGRFSGRTRSCIHDRGSMGADEIDALIVTALVGRAADLRWGRLTAGSAGGHGSDLATATGLAAMKIASLGLGGSILYRGDQDQALALLRTDGEFRRRVEADLDHLNGSAVAFVDRHADVIERIARRLLTQRVMGGDEVRGMLGAPRACGGQDPAPDRGAATIAADKPAGGGHA